MTQERTCEKQVVRAEGRSLGAIERQVGDEEGDHLQQEAHLGGHRRPLQPHLVAA